MAYDSDDSQQVETQEPVKPFWSIVKKSSKEILEWFENTLHIRQEAARDRIIEQRNNVYWYTGEAEKTMEYTLHRPTQPGQAGEPVARKILPVIFSHLSKVTDDRVSKISKYKASFDVQPTNSAEYKDRQEAKLMKLILQNFKQRQNVDAKLNDIERWTCVFGELYIYIEWNPDAGEAMLTKTGRPKKDRKGYVKKAGDVVLKIKEPWYVFPEPKRHWEEVEECIEIYKIMNIEDAKKKWPGKKINQDFSRKLFEFADSDNEKQGDEIIVYRILAKPSVNLPEGAEVFLTKEEILEKNLDWKYSHNDFPFERYTDIDVPGRLHGLSFYQHLKPIQHQYNKLTATISRNHSLCGHPKWIIEGGSVDVKTLGNATTIVKVKRGASFKPELASFQMTPPEIFTHRKDVLGELEAISGIHGISRGDPPGSIRSGIALQFLAEQEMEGFATRINKRNDLIVRIYQKAAAVAADYYPEGGKDRLLRIVGHNNEYLLKNLETDTMSSLYDIVIQNSTALSESKAGKVDQVIQLRTTFGPGVVSDQYAVDALDLGAVEKIYDVATAALRAAESENRDLLDGRPVKEPQSWEQHIIHWKSHIIEIQAREFKEDTPPQIQDAMIEHIMATETLMEELRDKNMAFAQQLMQLDGFPAVLPPPPPPPPMPAPSSMGPPGPMAPPPGMPPPGMGGPSPQADINGNPPGQAGDPLPQGMPIPQGFIPPGMVDPASSPAMGPPPGGMY